MRDWGSIDSALRQAVAGASTNDLLKQASFWRGQLSFLVIVGISIISMYILAPYTYDFSDGWGALTIIVQLLALWGAIISIKALAKLDMETAIICEIEWRGANCLREIESGRRARVELEHLEQAIVPNNPSNPPPAMIRLFQHICKEAKDRKFESSVNVIQSYREEPLDDIFKLQNLQKIALWLGILGTFIGLLIAIRAGNLSNPQSGDALLRIIQKMFDGLIISFSASLAGLEVAVILGFFLLLLRKRQESYFKYMESAAIIMLSLARNSINKDHFLAEFNQINATVSDLSNRVYEQTRTLSQRIIDIQKQIKDQTDQIQTGIGKLSVAGVQFDGFLKQASSAQQEFIDDVRGVYDVISLKNLGTTLQQSVIQAEKQMSDALGVNVFQISKQLATFNNSISTLNGALQGQSHRAAEDLKKIEDHIKALITESIIAIKTVYKQLQQNSNRDAYSAHSLKTDLQDLSRKIGDMSRAIEQARYLTRPRRRSFREFITSIRW